MSDQPLDPREAARFALVAICLILIGALLTAGVLSLEQRGAALVTIFGVLAAIAWRFRRE